MHRRVFLTTALAGCAGAAFAQPAGPSPAQLLGAAGDPAFIDWLNGFYERALAAGAPRAVLDRELSGLSPDPRVAAKDTGQPEFARPVSVYVANAASEAAAAIGRA